MKIWFQNRRMKHKKESKDHHQLVHQQALSSALAQAQVAAAVQLAIQQQSSLDHSNTFHSQSSSGTIIQQPEVEGGEMNGNDTGSQFLLGNNDCIQRS